MAAHPFRRIWQEMVVRVAVWTLTVAMAAQTRRRSPRSTQTRSTATLELGSSAVASGLVVAGWRLRGDRIGVGRDDAGQFVAACVAWLTCRRVARSPYAVPRAWTLAGRAALAWAAGEAILTVQHLALNSGLRPSP